MKKWMLRILLGLISLSLLAAAGIAVAFRILNRTNGKLVSAGETRAYLLYVPKSYNPAVPTPLVISIHGFAEWPAHQMQTSRWNDLADEYGFIVVYPSGTRFPLRWRTRGAAGSQVDPAQDIAFISDLIDKLGQDYNIDSRRIYANGLSNGGGMSFVLSCALSERIAAVGLVSGAYLYPWDNCRPTRPVPAVIFHGVDDQIVPFKGGPSRAFDVPFPVISDWVSEYAQRNGCVASQSLPTRGEVTGVQFTGCAADVRYYTIAGGGHSWPGGVPLPEWIAGRTTLDIDATRTMWEFFQQHPLP
jgi:polyhydroxybutyrate depolymerase